MLNINFTSLIWQALTVFCCMEEKIATRPMHIRNCCYVCFNVFYNTINYHKTQQQNHCLLFCEFQISLLRRCIRGAIWWSQMNNLQLLDILLLTSSCCTNFVMRPSNAFKISPRFLRL